MSISKSVVFAASFLMMLMWAMVFPQQARADQVLLEAPRGPGNYYGLFGGRRTAAEFTLTGTYAVSTIQIVLRTPSDSSFVTFQFSLQDSLTDSAVIFTSEALTIPVGATTTAVLHLNKTLTAGTYYLVGKVPGYVDPASITPGNVDGWLISTGIFNGQSGRVANGVWSESGNSWTFLSGNFFGNGVLYNAPAFTVNGLSALTSVGGFAQIASGSGWSTSMTLINLSNNEISSHITFYKDDGNLLTLPLSLADGSIATSSVLDVTIPASGVSVIKIASTSQSTDIGWADVQASGPLRGYAVFSQRSPGSAGAVTLDARLSPVLVLPYDNTRGGQTAIALANQSSAPATISAIVLDENGNQLSSSAIQLPAHGHSAFFVSSGFAVAANRTGLIQFQNQSGNVTGIGLLFSDSGYFSSLPIIQ